MRISYKLKINSELQRHIVYSQAVLYATFLVCIILAPASLADNGGFSYFDHHKLTVIPYDVGLIISAYYLLRAADYIRRKILRRAFMAMAPLMAGVAIVPATDGWLDATHRFFGAALFMLQFLVAIWFCWHTKTEVNNWLIFVLILIGGIIALIYLSPAQGFSLQGQLLFQVAFSGLLFKNLDSLVQKSDH